MYYMYVLLIYVLSWICTYMYVYVLLIGIVPSELLFYLDCVHS